MCLSRVSSVGDQAGTLCFGRIIRLRHYEGTVKSKPSTRGNNFVTSDIGVGFRLDGFTPMHNNAV